METITWEAACARRLERHGLAAPAPAERLANVADAICGVHAQVMSAAELSLGLRVEGVSRADVRAALWEEHALVKTYGPRGTVHLLPAEELATWVGALGATPAVSGTAWPEDVRFDDEQQEAVIAAIADALSNAELTAEELTGELVARLGPWAGEEVLPGFQQLWPRWRQATVPAAHRGALCFGPPRGRTVTFTSPARWVAASAGAAVGSAQDAAVDAAREPGPGDAGFAPAPADAALVAIVQRWLRAYGPATPRDYAQWAAAPRAWAAELFGRLADAGAIEPVAFEQEDAWVAAGDADLPDERHEGVRLLPYFDAYGIGCHPRARVFPGRAAERALSRGQAGPYPLLLIDGVVGGVWHARRSGRRVAITVEPLRRLGRGRLRELDAQVERVGAVLEARPALTVGPVAAGPHA